LHPEPSIQGKRETKKRRAKEKIYDQKIKSAHKFSGVTNQKKKKKKKKKKKMGGRKGWTKARAEKQGKKRHHERKQVY